MVFNKRVLISLVFKYELPGFRQWTFTLGCDTAAIASKKIQTTSVLRLRARSTVPQPYESSLVLGISQ